ncbi:CDP-glucose 4,6-dehydratase [Aquimarina sp. EL_43]|uniref:CDP-glucose 4,6-dehydratase n=1 Tax=unclassified Aquimarina TaxID=2627091 RepID=UPI0018CAF321|nr:MULTISPECIES: CDP-glucose 4,6-dehydratase [unclassified Aquimarina]MBG6131706.1 CDP-glucose 4,6-dehydratase [Aquimarina sp. EL_35]MBG6152167.1 CDP-glucose 4,6-dehydratase [Aquimarina sp. EL_32]MBG6169889.1 CDP-glucose 4,6-dehydratase [Aquimarina sp. EL_43]
MEKMVELKNLFKGYYQGKKVFITGHTGFKGSWMSLLLSKLGAEVYGYALDPYTEPNLFESAQIGELITSYIGDIRDYSNLFDKMNEVKPDVVIHMAAQPLVRESYRKPLETYEVNVMGTANLLEAVRQVGGVKVTLNVTTDKCYENKEWYWGYRENEALGGKDPYSSSKACSELVTSSFRDSFFNPDDIKLHNMSLVSARAGNVIGGGDWSDDRLIPDFLRAIINNKNIEIRNPNAIRPWQHVLECLSGYLTLIEKTSNNREKYFGAWNFGPDESNCRNVEWIVGKLCELWGNSASYSITPDNIYHEANYLKLDCSKAKNELNWFPKWDIDKTLEKTVEWNKSFMEEGDARKVCFQQIEEFFINTK